MPSLGVNLPPTLPPLPPPLDLNARPSPSLLRPPSPSPQRVDEPANDDEEDDDELHEVVGIGAHGEQQPQPPREERINTSDDAAMSEKRDARIYSPFCPHWASLHECDANPKFMLVACAASCECVQSAACESVVSLPHSLSSILGEGDPFTAMSLQPAEARALVSLAPAMREHIETITKESEKRVWFAHEGGLVDLTHGWRYRLTVLDRNGSSAAKSAAGGAKAAAGGATAAPRRARRRSSKRRTLLKQKAKRPVWPPPTAIWRRSARFTRRCHRSKRRRCAARWRSRWHR